MIRSIRVFMSIIAGWGILQSMAFGQEPAAKMELRIVKGENAGTFAVYRSGSKEPLLVQNAREGVRPYIHPIMAPDGQGVLTEYRPKHHLHQTGLYWGLKMVNGRDYFMNWQADYWRRVSASVIAEKGREVKWQTVYDMLDDKGQVILTETQNWSMQEHDGKFLLDLEWKGEAKTDITFGKFYVGGLFLRMPWYEGITGEVVNASGLRNNEAEGQRAIWADVGMQVTGRRDLAHIAIFDHPDNSAFPIAWRVDNELGIGPSRQILGDWEINAGETEVVRYRLVVYTGDLDHTGLTRAWTEFISERPDKASPAHVPNIAAGDTVWEDEYKEENDDYTAWTVYRGGKKAIQYSDLAQINAANVHKLEPVWEYHTGDPNGPSMYSNPIIVDGLMYFTTPKLHAIALDAATGEEVWVFDPSGYNNDNKEFRGRSRGVTYWEDAEGKNGRIFNFVKDRVYACDAKTGALIKSFGEGGHIDLRQHLPVDPERASIEVTSPGIVYKDFLIVGSRVPEGNSSTPGDVRAFNALTGEFEWIFHTIPQKGEFGYDTWEFVEGVTYGGANPWGGFSLDEERGWVFFATGSPAPDFIYGGDRKGKNLFGNCVMAVDAATGAYKWHFQTIHHDIFDYDNPPAPILVTIKSEGKSRDAVVQLTKMGFTFVLDRDTGEPLFPVVELPVPASNVPGEEAWPTQPFPLKPPPLARLILTESDLTNITPESRASVLEQFRKYKSGFLYTPASEQGTITLPGHQGGMEWGGGSFDPYSNVLYVNVNEAPTINKLVRYYEQENKTAMTAVQHGAILYNKNCTSCHGSDRQGNLPAFPALTNLKISGEEIRTMLHEGRGLMPAFTQLSEKEINDIVAFLESDTGEAAPAEIAGGRIRYSNEAPFFVDPYGAPAISPPWGTLNAIDLHKGNILWKVPLGEYPQLAAKGIRNTGAKSFGGPVSTAGDIVFIAGTPDEKIRAFSTHTGEVLWEYKLPAGGYATPSVYTIEGKQYVVIAAGGGGKNGTKYGDSIIAFALPDAEDDRSSALDKKNSGWIELFDGTTLNGWVHLNGSHTYTVEDGAIVGRTVPGSPNSFLSTRQKFDDFELELEVMVDSVTNSGIQIRSRVRPETTGESYNLRAGRVYGPQVEMQRNRGPGTPTTGLIYGEALGTGWLSSEDKIKNGHHHLNNNGWNKLRIVAKGARIQTWVNGHQVEDMINEEVYRTNPNGFIGLQMHGLEGNKVYVMKWRNIRIRPMP